MVFRIGFLKAPVAINTQESFVGTSTAGGMYLKSATVDTPSFYGPP